MAHLGSLGHRRRGRRDSGRLSSVWARWWCRGGRREVALSRCRRDVEAGEGGRQHSSRMCGDARRGRGRGAARSGVTGASELGSGQVEVRNSLPLSESTLKAPTGVEPRATRGERGGVRDGRAAAGARTSVGPRERAVGIDRGDLPHRALVPSAGRRRSSRCRPARRPGAIDCGSGAGSRGGSWRGSRRSMTVAERASRIPWRRSTFHTPLGETRNAPHSARASIAAIRRGPRPGCPSENARSVPPRSAGAGWASAGDGAPAA